jgi:hypothetical protein
VAEADGRPVSLRAQHSVASVFHFDISFRKL